MHRRAKSENPKNSPKEKLKDDRWKLQRPVTPVGGEEDIFGLVHGLGLMISNTVVYLRAWVCGLQTRFTRMIGYRAAMAGGENVNVPDDLPFEPPPDLGVGDPARNEPDPPA